MAPETATIAASNKEKMICSTVDLLCEDTATDHPMAKSITVPNKIQTPKTTTSFRGRSAAER
jgi:hypothetical protein